MEYNQNGAIFPFDGMSAIQKMITDAVESTRTAHESLEFFIKSNNSLLEQTRIASESMDALNGIIKQSFAMTPTAIRYANEMSEALRNISRVVGPLYGIPESRSEEVIARPVASEAKEIIRRELQVKKIVIPLKLPSGISWENICSRFVDGHNVFIETDPYGLKFGAGYREMGMRNDHTGLPNKQWKILQGLAETGGVISWGKSGVIPSKAKKQKQLLAQALKRYFGINGDPFATSRKGRVYWLKMKLLPETKENSDQEASDPLGIQEELAEKGASVFDPFESGPKTWAKNAQ